MSTATSPAKPHVPPLGSLGYGPSSNGHTSGDINTLLKDQQESLVWTMTLNDAIKNWVQEHALAPAETPQTRDASSKKWGQSDQSMDSYAESPQFGGAERLIANTAPLLPHRQQYPPGFRVPTSSTAEKVLERFWNKVAVREGSAQAGFTKPLLSDIGLAGPGCEQKDVGINGKPQNMSRTKRVDELLFPTADECTMTVQRYLSRPEETVEDLYDNEGMFQAWARSQWFNNLALAVILLNTIWIAVETDYNHADVLCNADTIFQVMDNSFCTFFVCELFIRLMAFKRKLRAFSDPWYIFDTLLVSLMVWETWIQVLLYWTMGAGAASMGRTATILRVFRLARLTRVARVGKLLRSVPELMILAKAMFLALRSVLGILVMLALVIYVFAVLLTQLLQGQDLGHSKFESVPKSMNFLLIQVLCGFDDEFMQELANAGIVYYGTFLGYLLIAQLTLMNMLIGILCNVVSVVSEAAKEENFVKDIEAQLEALAEKLDPDGDHRVSREEFLGIIGDYDLVQALNDTGVDVVSFAEYASFVFEEESDLSTDDFMRMIVQFRGDRVATVKELVSTRKYVTTLFESMQVPHRNKTPRHM